MSPAGKEDGRGEAVIGGDRGTLNKNAWTTHVGYVSGSSLVKFWNFHESKAWVTKRLEPTPKFSFGADLGQEKLVSGTESTLKHRNFEAQWFTSLSKTKYVLDFESAQSSILQVVCCTKWSRSMEMVRDILPFSGQAAHRLTVWQSSKQTPEQTPEQTPADYCLLLHTPII